MIFRTSLVSTAIILLLSISGLQAEERKTAVEVKNTPNVAVTNTPSVAVTNIPTVKIDPANNIVKAPAQSKMTQLFAVDLAISGQGGSLTAAPIDCTGYRQLRIVIVKAGGVSAPDWSAVKVELSFRTANDVYLPLGSGSFTSTSGIVTGGDFEPTSSGMSACCIMSMPVISDKIKIRIINYSSGGVMISGGSYVYLTN